MSNMSMHIITLTSDEMAGTLAAIDTILERLGESFRIADPEKHGLLVSARTKLYRLYSGQQQAVVGRA